MKPAKIRRSREELRKEAEAMFIPEDAENPFQRTCEHEFMGGICIRCLCPEDAEDVQRSFNAMENAKALTNRYSDVLGRFVTKEDAILEAWRSHHKPIPRPKLPCHVPNCNDPHCDRWHEGEE